MRLVDADAYSAEMKDRQAAAWKWRNEAIAEEDEVKLARAEGAYAAFTEAKLTMDKHIINPWHRVEEPPKEKHNKNYKDFEYVLCATTFGDVRPYKFGTPIGWDEPHFWYGAGIMDKYVTHWMPLPEPPKEDA